MRRLTRTRQREAHTTPPARVTAEGFIARGGIPGCTDRDIGKKIPFPKAQGKRGHPEEGVTSTGRKGFYPEQGDLRSRREIHSQEYITREGIQRKEFRANTV
jgi:hypothetical protein